MGHVGFYKLHGPMEFVTKLGDPACVLDYFLNCKELTFYIADIILLQNIYLFILQLRI